MINKLKTHDDRVDEAASFESDLIESETINRRGPIQWLFLSGALLLAVIAIGTAVTVYNFRERALAGSTRELENTVLLVARHFDQQLEELGAVQNDIVAQIQSAGITSSDELKTWMSSKRMHDMLHAKMSAMSYVGALSVFGADGQLVVTSDAWPTPAASIADRSYFTSMRSDPSRSTILSEPVSSRITGAFTTPLVRRLNGPNGEFLGVITRGVEPSYFGKFLASLALQKGASISIVHQSGRLLARYPKIDSAIGQNLRMTTSFGDILTKSDHGTVRLISPLDGKDRLASFRTLTNYPVLVVATETVSSVLESWRIQTRFLVVAAALSSIVIVALVLLIILRLRDQGRYSQRRLMLEKQRLLTAVNNMTQGLLLFDASGRLVVCNQRYNDMYGLSGQPLTPGLSQKEILIRRYAVGSFAGNADEVSERALRNRHTKKRSVVSTSDGRFIHIDHTPVSDGGWLATHEDITERRLFDARIAHLAHYDALTDLPNRTLFREKLESELARNTDDKIAVLYIDIDEFKSINDSLGHPVGDELLKTISTRLSGCIGPQDFVARLGGDEFAIVQVGIGDRDQTIELVDRVYGEIRRSHDCLGHSLSTDASIGIAVAPDDGVALDQLLKHADLAMYAAKAAGRRTFRFFEPDMNARMKERRALELDLREAITAGKLELHYQPSVSTRDNTIIGCEALVRWHHPQRGVISPVDFIPVAEQAGLIDQLGEWVLMEACREAATWPGQIKIAVNVSPIQFKTKTFPLKVASALATSGLCASRLEIEVTEAVLIDDDDVALAILHQLRDMGVRIALDDFGTGYSSLSYLQRFPFDKIKIDRCFVRDINEQESSSSIVQAVVNIARSRHMTTTAEGVETQSQLEVLRKLGCNEMQGYLFSAAKTAGEIRKLFSSPPLAEPLPAA